MAKDIGLRGRLDIAQFNANSQAFMKSINAMNKEVARVAKESASGAKQAGDAAGFLGINWGRVRDIITGVLVIDVFRQISKGLRDISREALDAASSFQILRFRLEALLARDLAQELGIPVGQALGQVSQKAEELLGWIRKVAVTTPFSVQSLTNAIAYGQAFGFNVEQSKRLTLATGEFVAGMGLTDEHMQRIIYNFGQMLASGRVLGRELRDLANNFVPIREITQSLADQIGIPFEEMKKAMSEGKVSAEQFIATFVRIAETDFEGAMERMARTMQGIRQNIQDFIQTLVGIELLGPIVDRITGILATGLDRAFQPDVVRAFAVVGQTLLAAFNQIALSVRIVIGAFRDFFAALGIGAPTAFDFARAILYVSSIISKLGFVLAQGIKSIAQFINNLSGQLGVSLGEIAQNAASWGANIVIALAEGMARAITYIIQVLTAIAKIFTYWLRGSSPPRLLPDLTKWGKAAIDSYLEGWTSGDFGVFNDIANVATSFLRSIANKIPKTGLIPRILGTREAIRSAIDEVNKFGAVTEKSLNRIVKAMGAGGSAVKNFVREALEFAAVEAIVKEARKVLDFDINLGVPKEIFGEIVQNFNDLIRVAGKFRGSLGDALRDYVQALGNVEAANKRVAEAQRRVNDLTEFYEDQLRELRAQQTKLDKERDDSTRIKDIEEAIATGLLTAEEKKRLEIEKEQILLNQKIASLEDERDVALDAADDKLEAEKLLAEIAEDSLRRQKELVQELADTQLAAAKEQLEVARATLEMIIDQNNLLQEQAKLLEQLAKTAAKGAGEGEPFDIPGLDFEGLFSEFEDTLNQSKDNIVTAIKDLQNEVAMNVNNAWNAILEPFAGIPERLSGLFEDIGKTFEAAKKNTAIQGFLTSIENFGKSLGVAFELVKIFWEQNGPGILETINNFFDRLGELVKPEFAGLIDSAGTALEKFGVFVVLMANKLVEKGPVIQESLQGWVDWIFDEGIPKLQEFWAFLRDEVLPVLERFVGFLVTNAPTVLAILSALFVGFNLLKGALFVIANIPEIPGFITAIQGLAEGAGALVTALTNGGGLAVLLSSIGAAIAPVIAILLALGGVILVVIENFEEFKKFFSDVFKSAGDAIKPAIESLKTAFADMKKAMLPLTGGQSPLKLFLGLLRGIGMIILAVVVPVFVLLIGIVTGIIRAVATGLTFFFRIYASFVEGVQRIVEGVKTFVQGLKDIIAGIGAGDFSLVLEGFKKLGAGITEFFKGLIQSIITFFSAMFGFILGLLVGFVEGFIGFFVNLYNRLVGESIIPDMIRDIIAAFAQFFVDALAGFNQWLIDTIAKIVAFVPDFTESGIEIITGLIEGAYEMIYGRTGLLAKIKEWMQTTVDTVLTFLDKFKQTGEDLIKKLIEGIKWMFESAAGVYAKIKEFLQTTIGKAKEKVSDFIQLGKDIIAGIISGLAKKAGELYIFIKNLIKNAIAKANETSKTKSPSKVFEDLGINWMEGFKLGLLSKTSELQNTIGMMFSELTQIPRDMDFEIGEASVQTAIEKLKELREAGSLGKLGANVDLTQVLNANSAGGGNSLLTQTSPSYTTIRTINVEINPTYAQVQSESSLYYDVRAAIAHMSR